MAGELITLPLRVGAGAARLLMRATEKVAGRAFTLPARVLGVAGAQRSEDVAGSGRYGEDAAPAQAYPRTRRGQTGVRREGAGASTARNAVADPVSPSPADEPAHALDEPAHVSEEPELVEAFAERGAEEGAGAEIRVEEPWDGYGRMNAKDIIARVRDLAPAELAAVSLYERTNRGRQTVLDAVDRVLRHADGGGSTN